MLIVLSIISLASIVGILKFGFIKDKCKCKWYTCISGRESMCLRCGLSYVFIWTSVVAFASFLIATVVVGVNLSGQITINQKIDMYESENSHIEMEISTIAENYMKYESDIFESVSTESPIVLMQLYPELKSNAIVEKQVTLYISNNDMIKSLKLKQINISLYRWWLYFGR